MVPFDAQPVLKGELVALRPLRADDYDALYAVASDPLIWEQHPANNRHEPGVFREFFADAMASGGALLATDATTGTVIGSSRYHDFDAARRDVEIGWSFLGRAYWGGRYNGEMKRLMLTHAFGSVDTVLFLIGPRNIRSQRAVERLGGVRAGMRNDAHGLESVVYALTPVAYATSCPPGNMPGGAAVDCCES